MELERLMAPPPITAQINEAKGWIVLKSAFVDSELVSDIPGAGFVGKGQDYWHVPLTWVSAVCLTNTFGNRITFEDKLAQWLVDEYEYRIEPVTKLRTGEGEEFVTDEMLDQFDALIPAERSPVTPVKRRYQVSGALLLATAKRFLLLDEQGTGKMTEIALTLSLYPETLPALIVSPNSTLYTWRRELAVFGVDSIVMDASISAAQRRKLMEQLGSGEGPQVLILGYGLLSKHSRVAPYGNTPLSDDHRKSKELNQIPWATVCADEAHYAKSPKTVQTRALWAVSANAEYRWALTGTPVESSPLEMWSLLHFVDPVAWPSSVKARDRWVDWYENFLGFTEIKGIRKDRADEWRRVTEIYWRRKAISGLPPLRSEIRYCELKGKQLKAYKDMERQLMAETGENDIVLFAQNHMVKAGRLKQMAQSAVEVEVLGQNDDGEDEIEVHMVEPSPKLDLMEETLESLEGIPLLVWFHSVKLMKLARARLDAKGVKYAVIDGSMKNKDRDAAAQSFQNGDVDLILLSVSAAAEGITLTRAPGRITVDRHWSLIKQDQKDRRNERIGSEIHDYLFEIDLVTKDTIEEKQLEDELEKRKIRDQVISPKSVS